MRLQQVLSTVVLVFAVASTATHAANFESLPGLSSSGPTQEHFQCATPDLDPITAALVEAAITKNKIVAPSSLEVQIPVAVHVITAGKKGKYSKAVIDLLINNLNAAYSGSGVSFYLVKLDYSNKRAWYESCAIFGRNEAAMKKKLAYNPGRVLNIYSCKPTGPGLPPNLIGYAYFPWLLPENHYGQGVVIHPGTLPSGAGIPGYDYYGLNAVHEVGHWLGLFHTFNDGCSGTDHVNDTPAQNEPTFTCDSGIDTCPADPGVDDVENFMNYVNDFCYDHFTPGQVERLLGVIQTYRPSLLQ